MTSLRAVHRRKPNVRAAFTLLELLAVMTIIAIVASLTIPPVNSTLRAARITSTGQALVDELNFAKQTAFNRNVSVEVRFYKLADYESPATGTPSVYRALQSFILQNGRAVPLAKTYFFPTPVVISQGGQESPFLSSPTDHPETAAPTGVEVPGYGTNYRFRSFQFLPGGSADFQITENSLTLLLQKDKPLSQGANFFTIQVNPINGAIRSFRP